MEELKKENNKIIKKEKGKKEKRERVRTKKERRKRGKRKREREREQPHRICVEARCDGRIGPPARARLTKREV